MHSFWQLLKHEFARYNIDTTLQISEQDILFGRYIQAKNDLFNHAIMHAKYYIHKQFVNDKKFSMKNFLDYYKHILVIEKERYTARNQLKEYKRRFGKTPLASSPE